ncbi:transposase [Listeria monocytogenes]|nr:transposase [Listeria monocytogenes]
MKEIFDEHNDNYGYRQIQLALKKQGINGNHKKFNKLFLNLD